MPEELKPPHFPTMLRKMWSGAEVQAWIDEEWNRRAQPAAPAVCSSCDGTGKISGLPCAWCMQSAAPSVAPEPVAWTLQSELDAAQTTCSAHLWFTNPRNSAWTALFTREQIAAHPPRAPLTEEQIIKIARTVLEQPTQDGKPAAWQLAQGIARAVEAAHGIGGK